FPLHHWRKFISYPLCCKKQTNLNGCRSDQPYIASVLQCPTTQFVFLDTYHTVFWCTITQLECHHKVYQCFVNLFKLFNHTAFQCSVIQIPIAQYIHL
ncbi:hypothetical protein XELAEV_18012298mg, partial [Xenopus laevis]